MVTQKPGRNDPCPCGSGKKYKHCCRPNREQRLRERRAQAYSPSSPRGPEEDTRQQIDEIRRISRHVMRHASPDQARDIERSLELAEAAAAYDAMSDEIEAAGQVLERLLDAEHEASTSVVRLVGQDQDAIAQAPRADGRLDVLEILLGDRDEEGLRLGLAGLAEREMGRLRRADETERSA